MNHLKSLYSFRLAIAVLLLCSIVNSATTETRGIYSNAMQRNIPVTIILPDVAKDSTVPLPVLYLLHGYGGNHRHWPDKTDIEILADRHQMLVVCPDGAADSWYIDSPVDSSYRYATHIAVEVVGFIDQRYSTIRSREGRAISGLSMGGHGALYLAIRFPAVFGAAGSMSGGLDLRPFSDRWNLVDRLGNPESDVENWNQASVNALLPLLKAQEIALIIDCGVDDFFLKVNRTAHQILLENKIDHDYIERDGGHSWAYWNNSVRYQMLFFSDFFRANRLQERP